MRLTAPLLIVVLAGCGGSGGSEPSSPIGAVTNGSFENPALAAGENGDRAPGWTLTGETFFVSDQGERPAFDGRQYAVLSSPADGMSTLSPILPAATVFRRLSFRVARPEVSVGALVQVFAGERVIATAVPVEGNSWIEVETTPFAPGESVQFVVRPSRTPGAALIDRVQMLP